MKELVRKSMLMSIIVIGIVFMFSGKNVYASYVSDIPLQKVEDIHNTPYPNMTEQDFTHQNQVNRTEFTIESAGEIRAIFRVDMLSNFSGSTWISTDLDGNNIVGKIGNFKGEETGISWFLEKGSYYLFTTNGERATGSTNYKTSFSTISMALLFEAARTQEKNPSTSFAISNPLGLEEMYRGFLSITSPSDYYSFTLPRKASVVIDYSFDGTNSNGETGLCTLYDKNELYLTEASYQSSNRGQKSFTYLLEPGTYYIRLSGILGNTTLNVTPMMYEINFTTSEEKKWTTEEREIHIDTTIDYTDIVVLHKDVKDTLINNATQWSQKNEAYVPVDGETFIAKDSGIYSVRITDVFGNNTMEKIKVNYIDITKPKVVGVKNNKAYDEPIKITWSDKHSGIDANKTTLNGKKVKSGIVVKDEGKYVLKVYDKVGNVNTIRFSIDNTAPTINVKNGATFKDIVVLQVKDRVSGVKKVVVDNVEQAAVSSTLYFYLDGEYVVEVWDNAGNYRMVEFKIKK